MDLFMNKLYGPLSRFADAHLYLTMDVIKRNGSISRKALAKELGIGEGSVRSIIRIMKDWEVLDVRRTGIRLTQFGEYTYDNIPISLENIQNENFALGDFQQGILVKGVAKDVTNGMLQRDIGVRYGSKGASVFVMTNGRLMMPMNWDMDQKDPDFAEKVRATGMDERDVFLLVGSDDPISSRVAAVSIALEML